MHHPFADQRTLFPSLEKSIQLSSCSQSALATPVANAAQHYLNSWHEKGMDWVGWMASVHAAKAEFAKLINADAKDVAVLASVSDIASSIGSALVFTPERHRIVLADIDFPSMGHVWLAHERKGAQVAFVRAEADGCIEPEAYAQAIDDRTSLVSVSHVAYTNGYRQDIRAIAEIAHAHGALVFVDAYQSAGSVHIDVQRDDIDILATGSQKYLLGTPGIAFAYIRPDVARALQPSNTGWFGRVNPFAFDIRQLDYAEGAARFDTGTPAMMTACLAHAALSLLNRHAPQDIESYLGELSRVIIQEADRLGLTVTSPRDIKRKGANTAIRVGDASRIERAMAERGYVVSARNDVIRIAPHFYNTEEDVVGALRVLATLV